jgi:hypothetical protein
VNRPRILLGPSLTELEWLIKSQLEQWAEVASFDALGVGASVTVVCPSGAPRARPTTERKVGRSYRSTVTSRKVAGIDVASSLVFCSLNRSSSSDWSSTSPPFADAASNAFMVGP